MASLSTAERSRAWPAGISIVGLLALVKLVIHLLINGRYGYHRDEFYYIIGGERLSWGYVDHPPLTPLLAALWHELVGGHLGLFRLIPALTGAAIVLLTGRMARELGGGTQAQGLAALAVVAAPIFIGGSAMFQIVAFDQLWWAVCAYLAIRLLNGADRRLWLALGAAAGVALLTKYTILFLLAGLGAGLLLTPHRRMLATRWPWLAALLALLIWAPHLLWLANNDWPTLEFLRNNNAASRVENDPLRFLLFQVLLVGPVALPLWLAGVRRLFGAEGRQHRAIGWAFVIVLGLMLAMGGKVYYPGPAYPMVLAAGGVAVERWMERRQGLRRWGAVALSAGLIITGALLATLVAPVLPPQQFVELGLDEINKEPAEMLGWDEFVATHVAVYAGLSEQERASTAILAGNYGEASALEVLGADYPAGSLPPVISPHNSYYLWGPGTPASTYIIVGYSEERLGPLCGRLDAAATITNSLGVRNGEHGRTVYLCRDLRAPLAERWPALKVFQ